MTRTQAIPRGDILVVDDEPVTLRVLGGILEPTAQLRFATTGVGALACARERRPDLVLLDAELPDLGGFEVCEIMKGDPALADIPIMFVTSHSSADFETAALAVGAVDFVAKPVNAAILLARVETQLRVKHLTDELRRQASIDALTQIANRRILDEAIEREWRRALREHRPLSMLLLDIDHFKLFNDHYGHPAGDECLRAVACVVQAHAQRAGDLAARYGGEEIALLLPNTARMGAAHVSRAILSNLETLAIPHAASPVASWVTMSIGIGTIDPDATESASTMSTSADLVRAADAALYAAKGSGRARAFALDVEAAHRSEAASPIGPPDLARRAA